MRHAQFAAAEEERMSSRDPDRERGQVPGPAIAVQRRRARDIARIFALLGILGVLGPGCHQHYYYYGNPPGCGPISPAPSSIQYGSTCDVPTQVIEGGTVLPRRVDEPALVGHARRPRVVVSENDRPRSSWKATDPEASLATTQVEGALRDSTVR
jgi:hypothetical protein